jgi:heterodisulfide reductase subunit A-like polyferredoxin
MNETSQRGSEGKQQTRTPEGPVGAILVVGAGIAGIQASLDLANSGFRVYLAEKSTAIGGKMATLDKTFPTNDCAMCIVSPKLVEVGRHPNIDVITSAELLGLEGTVGRFRAKIKQQPRYVSPDLCTGCGSCVEVCPIEVPSEFEQALASRKAIYKLYPQAIPSTFAITKRGTAPCRAACPANISVQGYVALTEAGRFDEALALVRQDNPFPGISGLACPRPCERACTRKQVDHAVQIRALKNVLFEHEAKQKGKIVFPEPAPSKEERIAIIGGGPAGLTAACYLKLQGYEVTIFEADTEPGGSLRKLAEKVVPGAVRQAEIDAILNLGIRIHLDSRIQAEEILSKFSLTYHAVLLATGPSVQSGKGKGEDRGAKASDISDVSSVFREFDPVTLQTNLGNIFVCGELALGKKPFINAIGSGKQAAISIDRSLRRVSLREGRDLPTRLGKPPAEEIDAYKEKALLAPQEKARVVGEEPAVEEAGRCMACGVCCECYQCVEACPAGALDHEDREKTFDLNVGSVILSPGFDTVPGDLRAEFGYGVYPNVVTSIEFERILSASGPTTGHVERPSDEQEPRRIAWIQCVGSRDTTCNRDYCSSVCCMYATKEAVIAREHDPNIEATIFYIDLRAFGKGFDDYVIAAEKKHGVRYVRAMVSKVYEQPENNNLEIRYVDEKGEISTEEFDLVVLSVGVQVNEEVKEQARTLGVEVDRFGFTKKPTFEPLATSRPGVFTCGVFNGPKDIPETVSEASGAAACAGGVLSSARGTLVEESPFQVAGSEEENGDPRIGVFICHCGVNISAIVDVKAVADYARSLPGVVYSTNQLYACSQDNQDKLREIIQEHRLNRVVISSCSPRTHEPLFQETLQQAGLNKYLFDMANIRDQCSWVHRTDNERATRKAMRLTRMAVANVTQTVPLNESEISIRSELLVIGGGLAGMTAAKEAATQGFPVVLVEQEHELGGHLRNLMRTVDGQDAQAFLKELRNQVLADPGIDVLTDAVVVGHSGYLGNYSTEVMTSAGTARTIEHGAVVVATGGHEARPEIYGLGSEENVLTQTDLEQRIERDPAGLKGVESVVMVQCAGSRDEGRPYCSRVCCPQAIKNAIALKALRPKCRVDVLYRDVRSYGLIELKYMEARKLGVNFVRYDPETNPIDVSFENGKVVAMVNDTSLLRRVRLDADLLVLSVGADPADTEELATQLKTPRNEAGFFIEAHAKLRPVDFATDGLYLAGLAHYPKSIPETISQAKAAVGRAATILSKESLRLSGIVSYVNPEQCAVCLTCVRACPYGVPFINEDHTAEINPALCHGCGICVAECPAQTIVLRHYTQGQLLAKIEALPDEDEGPRSSEAQHAEAGSPH